MTEAVRKLIPQMLALPEAERLGVLAELVASLDGPPEPGSEGSWAEAFVRRDARAGTNADAGHDWTAVRSQLLDELRTK